MSDHLYVTGSKELWDGTIDLLTDAVKMLLLNAGYTSDPDDDVVDASGSDDVVDHEVSGTGYTAGWGESGRKALASKTITADKANNRSAFDAADLTWTSLGADCGAITEACLIKEGGANDTTSRLISHHDFAVTPNGGDITMQIADVIRLTVS